MLQALLVDRFKLVLHTEKRQVPVYALVRVKPGGPLGPKLRASDIDCDAIMAAIVKEGRLSPPTPQGTRPCAARSGPGQLTATAISMAQLVGDLSRSAGRVVIDRTDLHGNFDLELTWTPDQVSASPPEAPQSIAINPNAPSLFTAIREQLGLKLESTKSLMDILVIDRAEKPTPD
jgi:uncharacterized protein (TIGR03435 family)